MNIKNINKIIFAGFIITVCFSFLGFTAESEDLSSKLIRLHVKANSDTDFDQEIKLSVKDSVSDFTEEVVAEAFSMEDAENLLIKNLPEIEEAANDKLKELNVNYKASASVDFEYFKTREYETFTLPAGEYKTLRISLGEAEGENWWCVVYPSLCSAVEIDEDIEELSEEEVELIEESPEISFMLYEWYKNIVNFFSE